MGPPSPAVQEYRFQPPPTPPESILELHIETSPTLIDEDDLRSSNTRKAALFRPEYIFDWTLRIIGALSALIFGVWAPLSYQLQKSEKQSNDEEISRLSGEIKGLSERMEMIGLLRVWEMCELKDAQNSCACQALKTSTSFDDLISYFSPLRGQQDIEERIPQGALSSSHTGRNASRLKYYFSRGTRRTVLPSREIPTPVVSNAPARITSTIAPVSEVSSLIGSGTSAVPTLIVGGYESIRHEGVSETEELGARGTYAPVCQAPAQLFVSAGAATCSVLSSSTLGTR